MRKGLIARAVQLALVALTTAAIIQELNKPREIRKWHGKIGFIPYDFRMPTWERIKESNWNPYETRILTPMVFGLGWTINIYALLENLGIVRPAESSEESFLLPNNRMRKILRPQG